MRRRVQLHALTSMLISLCVSMGAQQPQTPVQGVVAHIDDSKLFPDSLPLQYRLPEGMTIEDVIRSLPGVEILEDGTVTVNGKIVTRLIYYPNPSAVDSIVNMHGEDLKQETRAISPKDRGLVTNENYLAQLLEYAPQGLVCGYIMRNAWRKNLWGLFLIKEKKQYRLVYKEADKVEKRKIKSDQATILEASVNTQISKIEFDINNPVFTEVYGGSLEIGMVYDGDIVFVVTPSKAGHYRALNGHQYNGINDEYWQAEVDQFKQETK